MLCEIICDHFKQPRIQFYRQRFEYRFPYCDCPYSELCKHEVAVAITLRMLFKQPQFKNAGDFIVGSSGSWPLAQTESPFEL